MRCAGGGGPLLDLKPALDRALGTPVSVILTDKYPNLDAFRVAAARFPSDVHFIPEPVDELRAMAHDLDGNGYVWQTGSVRSFGASRVTYAIGVPANRASDAPQTSPTPSGGS